MVTSTRMELLLLTLRVISDYGVTGLLFVIFSFSVKSEKDVFDKDKEFLPAFSHQFFGDK